MNYTKKSRTEELHYVLAGEYYLPDIHLGEPVRPLRRWGRMKREYMRKYSPLLFTDLVLTEKLWPLLNEIDDTADRRLQLMMEQMITAEGITEELKKRDRRLWVQKMMEIRHRAEEVILSELIYEDAQ